MRKLGRTRPEVLDNYNSGVRLRCPACNLSDNQITERILEREEAVPGGDLVPIDEEIPVVDITP
jgi:hypothetical protein